MKWQPLALEECETIDAASRQILAEIGVCFGSRKALDILAAAGGIVDFDQKRVRIPENLLDQALRATSHHFRLWNRAGERAVDLTDGQVRGHNVGGCVRIFDSQIGRARDATRRDLEEMTVLIDALDNIHVCRPVVYPAEFPADLKDVYTAASMLQYCDKPYGVSAFSPENLTYILRLASAIAGGSDNLRARPFIWGSLCPDSPLSYSESTTDILIRYAEFGLPIAIVPCPLSGGTSPVTLAGTLVQQNAEFLAGLVLAQVIRPGTDIKYTSRPIPLDMRTVTATFGAIEGGMMSAALVQLAKRYGVCSDVYGLGTSSKTPDEQAGFEKALNGLMVALAGADLVAAAGLLEDALTSSMEQLVIDDELLGMIFRIRRGIEFSPETLALEAIARVGPGGDFLTDPHTAVNIRREYFYPELSYRSGLADWEAAGYTTILDAARDKAHAVLQSHQPPSFPEELAGEVTRILEDASRELSSIGA